MLIKKNINLSHLFWDLNKIGKRHLLFPPKLDNLGSLRKYILNYGYQLYEKN